MIRILKGKGTNIMGMAASQARLLSITSRMADNELRAQITNNAKMRLAADSSRISADYVNALNSATMMVSNYDEAGNSQFSKLTYNRLTQYSPFNTQYGLANTYGQLLVNENEAKIFEAAGGDLTKYLQSHGLEFDTTYFTQQAFDGSTSIEFEDEFGNSLGNFELAELKTMYFGGKIGNVEHNGFADNEDVYETFLKSVSNFSIAYNRCQNDESILKLIEGDIKTAVDASSNSQGYDWYRDVAAGKEDLTSLSTYEIQTRIADLVGVIGDISNYNENIPNDPYVPGATNDYYDEVSEKYVVKAGDKILVKNLEQLNFKALTDEEGNDITFVGQKYYYYDNKESMYGEKMPTAKQYVEQGGKFCRGDGGNEKADFNVWLWGQGTAEPSQEAKDGGVVKLTEGNSTFTMQNTSLIKVTSDKIDTESMEWQDGRIINRGNTGLPAGYIGLTKNGDNIYFLYGQNNSEDVCWTNWDGSWAKDLDNDSQHINDAYGYGSFVNNFGGNGKNNGIYEVDIYGYNNASTVEYDDTLIYDLSDYYSHRTATTTNGVTTYTYGKPGSETEHGNRYDNGMLFSLMYPSTTKVTGSEQDGTTEDTNQTGNRDDSDYDKVLTAAKADRDTKKNAYEADPSNNDKKKAYEDAEAYVTQLESLKPEENNNGNIAQNLDMNNMFVFRSENSDGNKYTECHNFYWDGTYFVVDPQGFYLAKETGANNIYTAKACTDSQVYTFKGDSLVALDVMTEWRAYATLLQDLCEDAFGHSAIDGKDDDGDDVNEGETFGNFHYTVNLLKYIEKAAAKGNDNAIAVVDIKENILKKFGVDLSTVSNNDFTYIGGYLKDLLSDKLPNGYNADGSVKYRDKSAEEMKSCQAIYDNYILNCLFDIYGEPSVTWIDHNNPEGDAEAKVNWYTNQFERMSKGYAVIEDGLANSNEWIEYALESGIVSVEQVDKFNKWNGTLYSNVATISEVTDEVAVAKAEAEYKKAMNEVENKDKRLDVELKNIDTEHSALQTEYESVKSVISKNIERSFKMYNA